MEGEKVEIFIIYKDCRQVVFLVEREGKGMIRVKFDYLEDLDNDCVCVFKSIGGIFQELQRGRKVSQNRGYKSLQG